MRKVSIAQRRLEPDYATNFTRAELRAQRREDGRPRDLSSCVHQFPSRIPTDQPKAGRTLSFPMSIEHCRAIGSFLEEEESRRASATIRREGGLFILNIEAKSELPPKELFSSREISRILGVSRATVYRWVRERRLHSYKIGRMLRFDPREVMESISRWGNQKQPQVTGG